jgi:hypothetical protein
VSDRKPFHWDNQKIIQDFKSIKSAEENSFNGRKTTPWTANNAIFEGPQSKNFQEQDHKNVDLMKKYEGHLGEASRCHSNKHFRDKSVSCQEVVNIVLIESPNESSHLINGTHQNIPWRKGAKNNSRQRPSLPWGVTNRSEDYLYPDIRSECIVKKYSSENLVDHYFSDVGRMKCEKYAGVSIPIDLPSETSDYNLIGDDISNEEAEIFKPLQEILNKFGGATRSPEWIKRSNLTKSEQNNSHGNSKNFDDSKENIFGKNGSCFDNGFRRNNGASKELAWKIKEKKFTSILKSSRITDDDFVTNSSSGTYSKKIGKKVSFLEPDNDGSDGCDNDLDSDEDNENTLLNKNIELFSAEKWTCFDNKNTAPLKSDVSNELTDVTTVAIGYRSNNRSPTEQVTNGLNCSDDNSRCDRAIIVRSNGTRYACDVTLKDDGDNSMRHKVGGVSFLY